MDRKTKVVIADSNEAFRNQISELLCNNGNYILTGATGDGSKALEHIMVNHPDIVLTDLVLSGTDGLTLLERATELPKELRPQIIVISSFVNNQVIATAESLGAAYFIQKPCEATFLLSRIKMFAKEYVDVGETSGYPLRMQQENVSIEYTITEIMHQIGFPAHIRGYQYLREAILRVMDNMDMINAVTKELYPEVAEKFHTTSSRVERAIRHAIDVAWNRGDIEILQQYFGSKHSNIKNKPTNSELIAMIADRLNIERLAS